MTSYARAGALRDFFRFKLCIIIIIHGTKTHGNTSNITAILLKSASMQLSPKVHGLPV